MAFAAPLVLLALAALPGLYFLLRLTPPAVRRIKFPPMALLRGLAADARTPARMPLWLLLLRLLAAAILIIGLAGPMLNPPAGLPGNGPVLLVIDNGWAAAADWPARKDAALRIVAAAGRAGRDVAILATARNAGNLPLQTPGVLAAAQARQMLQALQPQPWPVDRAGAAAALHGFSAGTSRIYLADGITDGPGFGEFMRTLAPDVTLRGDAPPLLLPPVLAPNGDMVAQAPASAELLAETSSGRVLARVLTGQDGKAVVSLPAALAAAVGRLALAGAPTAGGTVLLDAQSHAALVGLVGGPNAKTPYLGPLFFLQQALPAGAQTMTGDLPALIAGQAGVIILADTPLNQPQITAARGWMQSGGMLIRFAGPLTATAPDDLTPDPLLPGDRRLGGALTWTAPQNLAPFGADSPLAGLAPDDTATVNRQILADPTTLDTATVWAKLTDGTPLIVGRAYGRGYLVSVLTTANADWSGLALSGLYPAILGRLVALSHGAPPKTEMPLPATSLLDAFATLTPAAASASVTVAGLPGTMVSAAQPPGLYGGGAVALNIGDHIRKPELASLPGAAPLAGQRPETDAGPRLIATAFIMLAADLLISLFMRGLLSGLVSGLLSGLVLGLLVLLIAPPARAQNAALDTYLAYVTTGDAATDQLSADGLSSLAALVSAHTSAVITGAVAATPGIDDLNLYPLLYWKITAAAPPPSAAACAALQGYMGHGGLLLVDTAGGDAQAPGSGAGFAPGAAAAVERDTACLDLPPLEILTTANVIAHCFYIVPDFSGRFTGAPLYIATAAARDADGVTPIILAQNDFVAAWARDATGTPETTPLPGGQDQRAIAARFGTNLVIYALTGSYKADQTGLPALLNQLGP